MIDLWLSVMASFKSAAARDYQEALVQTHVRQATSHPALLAGIMGLGCGIGVRKMARISSSVTESELDHTVNWRFSLENIRAANEAVVRAMDGRELPNLYRQTQDQPHTASDGQKFEVRGDSLHAGRIRLLRRKTPRHHRCPAPEKSGIETT